jgi:hypothetical protein
VQQGPKPKRPLDYSKSKESDKTRQQLLDEGYKEIRENGKTHYYKESESTSPKLETSGSAITIRPTLKKAPSIGMIKKRQPIEHSNIIPKTKPSESYNQEVVHLKENIIPKAVGVNSDISARSEEKRNDYGNMYTISYPDLKNGAGMSKATTEMFNNDPSKGAIGAHISGHDSNGNPIFSGKTQKDFTPEGRGQTAIMSNDVNKNSLDYQLGNSKNPIERTGNKFQENTTQGLNAPYIDKTDQGINTGLMDREELPSVELKKRDTTPIKSPGFKKGGFVMTKAPKRGKK